MRIVIPDEQSRPGSRERRVALVPAQVRELTHDGHNVLVQAGAGSGAGFDDADFEAAGATVVHQEPEALMRAELLLSVSLPSPQQIALLPPGVRLLSLPWTDLAPPAVHRALSAVQARVTNARDLQDASGAYPVVAAMSRVVGAMAPQIAARLLESSSSGRFGVLLGRLPGVAPPEVVILGAGTLGTRAAHTFAALGCSVHLMDADIHRLEALADHLPANVATHLATASSLVSAAQFANVLVGAARRPRQRAPLLVHASTVANMRRGSVILDFAIDEGGCVETSRPIAGPEDAYEAHGVVHFAMPNTASLVARTASRQLSLVLLPFVRAIASEGS